MILVIDNYDSFTYNLVQYIGELGYEVVVKRNDEITCEEVNTLNPEKIVISPGPCTPLEAGISVEIIKTIEKPIFGAARCASPQNIYMYIKINSSISWYIDKLSRAHYPYTYMPFEFCCTTTGVGSKL